MNTSKKLSLRLCAGLVATALIASCGGGSGSSDTTDRTRNAVSAWSATTTPTRKVLYGTQDGIIQFVEVPTDSEAPVPSNVVELPMASHGQTVTGVAFDSARSDVVYSGNTESGGFFLSKVNINDAEFIELHSLPAGTSYGSGYDSNSRVAVHTFLDSGQVRFVMQSIDDDETMLESKVPFYAIANYDGSRAFITTGGNLREVRVDDVSTESPIAVSEDIFDSPSYMWGFAKDPSAETTFAVQTGSGTIVSWTPATGPGYTKVGNVYSAASIAAFSNGTLVVGSGSKMISKDSVVGKLTVVDPAGVEPTFEIKTIGSGGAYSGVQSVWAIESPIAEFPPTINGTGELGTNAVCSDAAWYDDLPLSRLSRSPIEGVRTVSWFRDGLLVDSGGSDTYPITLPGSYQCAVTAVNIAGSGRSALSNAMVVSAAPGEVTTTTLESSGGSEATPGGSPIVTVPEAATGSPIVVATPALKSAKWTFKGRTAKVTFKKWSGAKKYRLYITGATKKTIVCKTAKTTVTCSTSALKKGLNSFNAKALSTSGIALAVSSKTKKTR